MPGRRPQSRGHTVSAIRCTLAGAVLLALASAPAWAHRGHRFGSPFHAVTLEQAGRLADEESKLVYVFVTEPKGQAPRYLVRPTLCDWRAIDLLILETVAVKLDAGYDADQLRRYRLDQLPIMLLLASDGTERQRFAGDLMTEQLIPQLAAALSDDDALARVRRAVTANGGNDPLARERLAQALVRRGDFAGALREYRWCVEVGLRSHLPYASGRRRLLFRGFALFAGRHPPARQALEAWRTATEQTLLGERDDANLARDLAELNAALNDEGRTLTFFDRLAPRCRARNVLFDSVFELLIAAGRYDEVLAVLDPARTFRQEVHMARRLGAQSGDDPAERPERGTRAFAIARGAALMEALAATGRVAEARALADEILKFDHTSKTHALLKRHAERAQSQPLIENLMSRTPQASNDAEP